MSDYFNGSGQINASSVKDMVQQMAKFAAILQEGLPSNVGHVGSSDMTDARRDELVVRALNSEQGKLALAQTMANPIRKNLDYQGVARRALVVDPLPQGAIPTYDRDIDVSATVISSNGAPAESRVFADRILVPTFTIASNPTVRFEEARRRRFNVIDRAVQKARQEIQAQEDANVFAALDVASSVENTVQDIADGGMQKRDLVEIKSQVDGWDLVTAKFFMNINEFNDILNWASGGGQGPTGGEVDMVTQREIMQTGLFAKIWGADIIVSKIVPAGTVYGCADPEFVGVMPVRQDIEVIPADEPKRLSLGWVVYEEIGLAITTARGVAKGAKSTLPG